MSLLTLVLKGPTADKSYQQYQKYQNILQAVELRLDLWSEVSLSALQQLVKKFTHPWILTYKTKPFSFLIPFLSLSPSFVDIEGEIDQKELQELKHRFPSIQWIFSYHNFEQVPEDIHTIYSQLQQKGADIIKIACYASTSLEAIRLFLFSRKLQQKHTLLAMGPFGRWLRKLGGLMGNEFHYVAVNKKEALYGQLSIEQWYQEKAPLIKEDTALYALLGDPVSSSRGPIFHNRWFQKQNKNAYYLKIPIQKSELAPFLRMATQLPFQGFSVTMPLKEEAYQAVSFLEKATHAMGSINTLVRQGGTWRGENTDASSALDLIEKKRNILNQRFLILGTGGSAKAIGTEAKRRGADVIFVGRDPFALRSLQKKGFQVAFLSEISFLLSFPEGILVHCTPVGMDGKSCLFSEDLFSPSWLIMDLISVPLWTPLLLAAKKKGCSVITGRQLFLLQAKKQQAFWDNYSLA